MPYDFITDDHVAAGWLDRYQAIVVPGAWYLLQQTHQALVAYANKGGRMPLLSFWPKVLSSIPSNRAT